MQILLKLDIWLKGYEEFANAKNNSNKLSTIFANIISLTSQLIPADHVTYTVKAYIPKQ